MGASRRARRGLPLRVRPARRRAHRALAARSEEPVTRRSRSHPLPRGGRRGRDDVHDGRFSLVPWRLPPADRRRAGGRLPLRPRRVAHAAAPRRPLRAIREAPRLDSAGVLARGTFLRLHHVHRALRRDVPERRPGGDRVPRPLRAARAPDRDAHQSLLLPGALRPRDQRGGAASSSRAHARERGNDPGGPRGARALTARDVLRDLPARPR